VARGTFGGFVVLARFAAGGLHIARFAGTGAHGARTLLPPTDGFGGIVESSGILAAAVFVMGLGAFFFAGGAYAGRAGAGAGVVVPSPGVGRGDRAHCEQKCSAEGQK